MITHEINKEGKKEFKKVNRVWQPVVVSTPVVGDHTSNLIKNQRDFNQFLNNVIVNTGDYCTYKAVLKPSKYFQIFYVRYIETDFDKIKAFSKIGVPQCVSYISVVPAQPSYFGTEHFFEWTPGNQFRKLTPEEYAETIDDNIRNYIQSKTQQHYSALHQSAS